MAVVTTIGTALQTSRNDHTKVAEIKSETDKQIDAIEAELRKKEGEESSRDLNQIGELRSHLEDTVTTALAARPPTPEQIKEVGEVTSKLKEDFNRQARQAGSTPLPPSETKVPAGSKEAEQPYVPTQQQQEPPTRQDQENTVRQ